MLREVMPWILAAPILTLMLVPLACLLERKIRQAKTEATLKIASADGIDDEYYEKIGGIEQWISIRSEARNNPVLLVLHGGPGCSYSIFAPHMRAWEKHFTLVQWDQRGGGKTFAKAGKSRSTPLNFEQLTHDAIQVTRHICDRLNQSKIFLLASSLGSTFGTRVVRLRPELFYAYIGTDQNVGMGSAGHNHFNETIERLRVLGLQKGVTTLERIGADPFRWSVKDFEAVAHWTMRSRPADFKRTMKLLKEAVWYSPRWRLMDIRSFVAGMHYSLEQLLPDIVRYSAWQEGTRFRVPFFVFQGEADTLTPPKQAKAFFDDLAAPMKCFRLIPGTGHFAAFLEPQRFLDLLLLHVRPLADVSADLKGTHSRCFEMSRTSPGCQPDQRMR